jgi:hypothetical protein
MFLRVICVALVAAVSTLFAPSTSNAQTTAPATMPATAPADPATPKGTLKLLAGAMDDGDVETLRELILADSPLEGRMRDAQISLSRATAVLRDALVRSFGEQVLGELNTQAELQQRLADIDAANADVNGDSARITIGPDKYDLKRIGQHWKLSLGATAKDLEPVMLEQSLEEMAIRSTVYEETAIEVADGRYQNTDEVGQALQGKLMVAMMRQAAATEPAATQESGLNNGLND